MRISSPSPGLNGSLCSQSGEAGTGEAAADLEALGRRQRQHGAGQSRFELVEHRLAEPGRHAAAHALHHAAEGVAVAPGCLDGLHHQVGRSRVGAAGGARLHVGTGHRGRISSRFDVVHRLHPPQHLYPGRSVQQLAGDGGRRDPADGLAGRRPPAAGPVPEAVLGVVGVVGVGGPVHLSQVLVGLGAGVLVAHQHRYGCAGGVAAEGPGQDLGRVGLAPLGHQPALARAAPVQIRLNVRGFEGQPGRAAVDHHTDAAAVRLAEGGDPEQGAERAGHASQHTDRPGGADGASRPLGNRDFDSLQSEEAAEGALLSGNRAAIRLIYLDGRDMPRKHPHTPLTSVSHSVRIARKSGANSRFSLAYSLTLPVTASWKR